MRANNFEVPGNLGPFTIYNVTAIRGGDCFLFVSDTITFLFDSGFGFCSEKLYANISKVLGERTLDYVLLTHSHYDHCLGSAYLRKMYPELKVVAFEYAAKIMGKESARATMKRLNDAAANTNGVSSYNDYFDYLKADISVSDGEILDLNGHKVQIVSLPGHTRDSIAYYFLDEKLMLGTETLGMYVNENIVMPSFLVGYKMSLESIKKAMDIAPQYYMIPHWGLLSGDNVNKFLSDSYESHIYGRNLIVNAFLENKTMNEIVDLFEEEFYTPEVRVMYPPAAFVENVTIQIPLILREENYFTDDATALAFKSSYVVSEE